MEIYVPNENAVRGVRGLCSGSVCGIGWQRMIKLICTKSCYWLQYFDFCAHIRFCTRETVVAQTFHPFDSHSRRAAHIHDSIQKINRLYVCSMFASPAADCVCICDLYFGLSPVATTLLSPCVIFTRLIQPHTQTHSHTLRIRRFEYRQNTSGTISHRV